MIMQFTSQTQPFSSTAEMLAPYLHLPQIKIQVEQCEKGLQISHTAQGWTVQAENKIAFCRALSLLKQFCSQPEGFDYQETIKLQNLGVMLDCSRSAVPTVSAVKKMLIHLAFMGYTTVQMYTEDVFEMEDYPYFGYLRGRYTQQELKEIDGFANALGIEMVPCIQTLAHLLHALKWKELQDVWDIEDILLCGEEKTYQLIDKMFSTMSSAFSSRKINIGMDEAHSLGLGKYLDKHGYHNRFDIMLAHLNKVVEIAKKYGYEPMMWSDMFFRLANNGEYYATGKPIDPTIAKKVPPEVSLVYWDYYSEKEEIYHAMLKSHKEFGRNVVFAGGAWKWTGFAPQNAFSMQLADMAAKACFDHGIQEVLITCWGDNGAEASMFSVLPALNYWAELCWAKQQGQEWCKERFAVCCNGEYDAFMLMDKPNFTPNNPAPGVMGANPSKYLLYQDVLMGMADAIQPDEQYAQHFAQTAQQLKQACETNPYWVDLLEVYLQLCRVLELKANLGTKIRTAYAQSDRATLEDIVHKTIPELISRLEQFQRAYHIQWLQENKPFGLEQFDIRTGGLRQRILTAKERLDAYLNEQIENIPELEVEILPFVPRNCPPEPLSSVHWDRIVSPGAMTWV